MQGRSLMEKALFFYLQFFRKAPEACFFYPFVWVAELIFSFGNKLAEVNWLAVRVNESLITAVSLTPAGAKI
jgi:hypothetical protein